MAENYLFSLPRWLLWPASLHGFIVYVKWRKSTLVLLDKALNISQVKPHRAALCQTDARLSCSRSRVWLLPRFRVEESLCCLPFVLRPLKPGPLAMFLFRLIFHCPREDAANVLPHLGKLLRFERRDTARLESQENFGSCVLCSAVHAGALFSLQAQ